VRPRLLIPLLCLLGLMAADAASRRWRERPAPDAAPDQAGPSAAWLAEPYPLPHFSGRTLDDQQVSLDTLRGKVALVNFWATWCLPCRVEIPALVDLQAKYRDRLVVVGVLDDNAELPAIRAFADRMGINYPIVRTSWDLESVFSEARALPTTYVVDRQGRVVAVHAGLFDAAVVEREVRELVSDPRP